jgi:SAM-dependent methyltransferase
VAENWVAYFDGLDPGARLLRDQAAFLVDNLVADLDVGPGTTVLDYGGGFGFVTATLAPSVGHVSHWDPAANARSIAQRVTADLPNVAVLEHPPEPAGHGTETGFDLLLVNSVVQYMTPATLKESLRRWNALLAAGGRLVLSDLVLPSTTTLSDTIDLLRFGARHGAAIRAAGEAVGGVGRYLRMRRRLPLHTLDPEMLERECHDIGCQVTYLSSNLTHFSRRATVVIEGNTADSHTAQPHDTGLT